MAVCTTHLAGGGAIAGAGSITAGIQTPTIAGSLFTITQRAGATGVAAAIGAKVGAAGFTAGRQITAGIQTPTIAGSLFTITQRAGAIGAKFGLAGFTAGRQIATGIQTTATAAGARVGFRGCVLVGGGAILGVFLAPHALPAFGFGAAGITAKSMAAAIMTPTTAAGSWFAFFQSAGATGAAAGIAVKAVGAGVGGLGGALSYLSFK